LKLNASVPRGATIEAHLDWPATLAQCDLKLVLTGTVVWTDGLTVAVRRQAHEFRTVSRRNVRASV